MLLLKKHLVELVIAGKKRQTIRFWSRPIVSVGQISFTPGLGKILITKVEQLAEIEQLTQTDALADGFASRAELLDELKRLYPTVPPGKRLYRVVFEWPVPNAVPESGSAPPVCSLPTVSEAGPSVVIRRGHSPRPGGKPIRPVAAPSGKVTLTNGMNASQRTELRNFIQNRAAAAGWLGNRRSFP